MYTFNYSNKQDLQALINTQETLETLQLPNKKAVYECPHQDCQKQFKNQGSLNKHYRTHTGERPYHCNFQGCFKSFTQISNLKRHKMIHTGDKPYKCKKCLKGFTTDSNLQQHRQTHASKTTRTKFACTHPHCNKSYFHQNSLKKHMKNFHTEANCSTKQVQSPSLTENKAMIIPVIRRVQSEPLNTQKSLLANLSQLVKTQELQLLSEQKQYNGSNTFNLYEHEIEKQYPQQSLESLLSSNDSFSNNEELLQNTQNINADFKNLTSLYDQDDQLNRKRKLTQLFDNLDYQVEPELVKMTDNTNGIANELKMINMLDTQENKTELIQPIIPFQFDFQSSQMNQSFQNGESISQQDESCQLYTQNFNSLETQLLINQKMFFLENVQQKFF